MFLREADRRRAARRPERGPPGTLPRDGRSVGTLSIRVLAKSGAERTSSHGNIRAPSAHQGGEIPGRAPSAADGRPVGWS